MSLFCRLFHWPWHYDSMYSGATARRKCKLCGQHRLTKPRMTLSCRWFHKNWHYHPTFTNTTHIISSTTYILRCSKCGQRRTVKGII